MYFKNTGLFLLATKVCSRRVSDLGVQTRCASLHTESFFLCFFCALNAVKTVVGEAVGKFLVLGDEFLVARGVAEGTVKRARESAASEHLFHDVVRNLGEVALHGVEHMFPEFAGGAFAAHAEHGQEFGPVDDGIFGIAGGGRKERGEAFRRWP